MDPDFKAFLLKKGITEAEYKNGELKEKTLLIEMFERSATELRIFKEDTWRNTKYFFPPEGLGKIALDRKDSVIAVLSDLELQRSKGAGVASLYLYGPRASGKTIIMTLLAKRMKEEGYVVYYYSNGAMFDSAFAGRSILDMIPTNEGTRVAIFVDEVPHASGAQLVSVLKSTRNNLVVVGAGVPQFLQSGFTAYFRSKRSAELRLHKDSVDMAELVSQWQQMRVAEPRVVEGICDFLVNYCGGHFFPTARLMEYAFTHPAATPYLNSVEAFLQHFFGAEFHKSETFKDVMTRCFDENMESDTVAMVSRVLAGRGRSEDISTINRLGWWCPAKGDIISSLLANVFLGMVKPEQLGNEVLLQKADDPQENVEALIVAGLENMQASDFYCIQDPSNCTIKVEDGITFSWAHRVMGAVRNAFLQFQARASSGRVDVFCNGTTNGVVEVVLNGTHYRKQSQSIPDHLDRMVDTKYAWKTWVMLNFAMRTEKMSNPVGVIIPASCTPLQRERLYTYVHAENALYQGSSLIKMPAVRSLPCSSYFPYRPLRDRISQLTPPSRSYSTTCARSVQQSLTQALHLVRVLRF